MTRAPVLMLDADFEPLQQLARHGVPIVAVTRQANAPVRASRSLAGVETAPPLWEEGFDDWFAALLARHPGAVIMPGSDDFAWYLDDWRERNGDGGWRFAVAPRRAVHTATAKGRLYEACREVGVPAPRTWPAPSPEALTAFASEIRFPAIVKPQSRVGNPHWGRGQFVRDETKLREAVKWALEHVHFEARVVDSIPGIEVPMVQEAAGGRDRPVYHLCGYLSAARERAVLAHRKILQVPRRLGSGICFEAAEVDARAAEDLFRLLEHLGFQGMFEAEFVPRGGEYLLIDLNIRKYNGMRLEAERGLEAAWYLYLEAVGEREELSRELEAARALPPRLDLVYCRKLELAAMLTGQFAFGGFGVGDVRRWVGWYWRNRNQMVDPWEVPGDRAGGRVRLRRQVTGWVKSPRQFLGAYARRESRR